MRRLLLCAVSALVVLAAAAPAHARQQLRFRDCAGGAAECARLSVPLDRTGSVPGRVSLFVQRREARRPTRPPLVLLAGGPGQSATSAFSGPSLGPLDAALRSRDVIVYDQRGTGRSGLLRCPVLERESILQAGEAAARCARRLGARRAFYTSRDSADDIEALRVALGAEKLALYGVSYGTRTATAYALRHPGSVDRLVLDSVVETDGPDALYGSTFAAIPRVLRALCGPFRCRSVTSNLVGDLDRLADRMARGQLRGRIVDARGNRNRARFGRLALFGVLLAGDFDAGLRAALPGAVRAALVGRPDVAPLLRLKRRAFELESGDFRPRELSTALYAATTCEEADLPWERGAPFSQRRDMAAAAAAARPDSAFFPLDRGTALDSDIIDLCSRWPEAPTEPVPGPSPLPDVPALLIEGGDDLRTSVEAARTVAAQLPQAKLLTVPGVGHSVIGVDPTGCSPRAFAGFLNGGRTPARCRGARRPSILPKPPRSLREVRPIAGARGRFSRTANAFLLTLDDVSEEANARLQTTPFAAERLRGAGLRAGHFVAGLLRDVVRLRGVSYVPGVTLSGRITRFGTARQRGTVRIGGRRAARGVLDVRGGRIVGRLGRARVTIRLGRGSAAEARRARASGAQALPSLPDPIRRRPRPLALPR